MQRTSSWIWGLTSWRSKLVFSPLWCGILVGCGGSRVPSETAVVAATQEAQRDLRRLEEQWELLPPEQRGSLQPELERFIREHGTDPSVARARLLLARLLLERGELLEAEQVLSPVLAGVENLSRDSAEIVQAAIDNRRGQSEEALLRLARLDGKIFSSEWRDLHARERVRAALATRRWRLAVDAMTDWLAISPHQRKETESLVRAWLGEVPSHALSRLLLDFRKTEEESAEARARLWVQREVIEQLTREALQKKDARLARDLLLHSPAWLRASEVGDELVLLSTFAREDARIEGRVVGLVLGGASLEERRRSVQMAVGLFEELRQSDLSSSPVRVIVEENRGSIVAALSSLSGQGASLLVAGVDAENASLALKFAEARQIPVLTLVEPESLPPESQYGFVLGERAETEYEVLAAALAREGGTRLARVGTGGVPCERELLRPEQSQLPWETWSSEEIQGLVVLGDPSCVSRVAREIATFGPGVRLAVGLEAAEGPWPDLRPLWSLRANSFPEVEREKPRDREVDDSRADLSVPGWFEVLGRDAARLVAAALETLPETSVSDEQEVKEHHRRVRDALWKVDVPLQTTEARGFSRAQILTRTLSPRAHEATVESAGGAAR